MSTHLKLTDTQRVVLPLEQRALTNVNTPADLS